MNWKRVHRWVRAVWLTGGALFIGWLAWNAQSHGVSGALRESDLRVEVTDDGDVMQFMPRQSLPSTPALVFLPGGGVDPIAYVPIVRGIAEAGVPAAIVRLPWRMAFSESAKEDVRRRIGRARMALGVEHPLVLAGHSRGAALAGGFAAALAVDLGGLIMIATTHPRDHDLSALTIPVLKIAATRDCVADLEASRANAHNLPGSTKWVVIDGGNHAQFAWYGSQLGDCQATIDRQSQHQQTLDAILAWLVARRS